MITGHHQSDRHSQATQIWFAQKCGKTQLPCFHGRNAIVESFGVVGVCRRQSQVQTSPYLDIYLVPLGVSGLRPYLIAQLRWTEPRPNLFKLKARSHWMNWFVPIIFTPLSLHPIYLKYPVFFRLNLQEPPNKSMGKNRGKTCRGFYPSPRHSMPWITASKTLKACHAGPRAWDKSWSTCCPPASIMDSWRLLV